MKTTRVTILALLFMLPRASLGAAVPVAAPRQDPARPQPAPAVERDEQRRVRVRLGKGGRVSLDNRTTGRIVATGWDNDYIEAVATSERGREHVRASLEEGPTWQRVSLKADYLTEPWPSIPPLAAQPIPPPSKSSPPAGEHAPSPDAPRPGDDPEERRRLSRAAVEGFGRLLRSHNVPDEVHLEVKLPRYAEIELITVNRSEVEITGVATPVAVSGKRSAIRLRGVGAAEVRTERGPVEVRGVTGLVDVVTTGGDISVSDVRGDVRALSLSGGVSVRCVRGRVNVSNTSGPVSLAGVDGDTDATTVNSDVTFDGRLRPDGRYHLKSMAGSVEMRLRRDPPGFTALLSSYRGAVESDFKLASKQPKDSSGTRILGRHGDGRAQITLDSFDGRVKLVRLPPGASDECK
jgi:hypothetical protein